MERPGPRARRWAGTGSDGRRRLGPDVLGDGVQVGELVSAVGRADSRRVLGDVLLDQRIVAGIGNIWAAEALWQARLSPWLATGEALA